MTRIGTKWITMVIVLVLAAGAWAERKRGRDRERPDRRPETRSIRSMADEHRGDLQRREHEERNRERERVERKERERREREHRERAEREKREEHERRNRERERGGREEHRRDEHRRQKPEIRVFRFEHIPAESFMSVLHQLAQKSPIGEIMSKIPIALEEHSNAVVVIAPPEAMELFDRIANELDAPSEFHKRMAQRGRPALPRQPHILRKPGPHKKPGAHKKPELYKKPGAHKKPELYKKPGAHKKPELYKKPGAHKKPELHKKPGPHKKPTHPKHPAPGKGPGAINEEAIRRAIGNPVGQLFGKILSARDLRLDERQRKAMHDAARDCGRRVGHMHQRVIQAIRGMGRDERASNARKTVSRARAEMGKMAGDIHKRIFGILKPSQHKTAARIIGAPGPAGNKGAKPAPCPSGRPRYGCGGAPSPTAAPRGRSGCGGCRNR